MFCVQPQQDFLAFCVRVERKILAKISKFKNVLFSLMCLSKSLRLSWLLAYKDVGGRVSMVCISMALYLIVAIGDKMPDEQLAKRRGTALWCRQHHRTANLSSPHVSSRGGTGGTGAQEHKGTGGHRIGVQGGGYRCTG